MRTLAAILFCGATLTAVAPDTVWAEDGHTLMLIQKSGDKCVLVMNNPKIVSVKVPGKIYWDVTNKCGREVTIWLGDFAQTQGTYCKEGLGAMTPPCKTLQEKVSNGGASTTLYCEVKDDKYGGCYAYTIKLDNAVADPEVEVRKMR
jgi:hypothetical protein